MIHIKFHKWNKKERKCLFQSCSKFLNIKEIQFYQPHFSLYFHIHNTHNSHQSIDLDRRYFLKEIISISNEKYYTSNINAVCSIYDKSKNVSFQKELFCKCIPLLDPTYYIMNNYNNFIHRNNILPSCYNYNTSQKINNIHHLLWVLSKLNFHFSLVKSILNQTYLLLEFPNRQRCESMPLEEMV